MPAVLITERAVMQNSLLIP